MRALHLLICVLAATLAATAASFPTEITLSNGAKLRTTSFIRWQGDHTVVVKHAGGAAPLQLRYLATTSREAIEAWREQQTPKATKKENTESTVNGVIFVATRGGNNYPLGSILVSAFPKDLQPAFESELKWSGVTRFSSPQVLHLAFLEVQERWSSRALATTHTDAEGRFSLPVQGDIFVAAAGTRIVGKTQERYAWVQPADDGEISLANHNLLEIDKLLK